MVLAVRCGARHGKAGEEGLVLSWHCIARQEWQGLSGHGVTQIGHARQDRIGVVGRVVALHVASWQTARLCRNGMARLVCAWRGPAGQGRIGLAMSVLPRHCAALRWAAL